MLALYRTSTNDDTVWGHGHDRPRFVALGVQITNAADALDTLSARGATPGLRHRDGWLVELHRGLPVVICPDLLPGDPRRTG